jgi:hypothetical protein
VTAAGSRRRPQLRSTMIVLALLTVALFAAGVIYGFAHRNDAPPCGEGQLPVKERPGILGQTEYLCPDGRTVTQ